MKLSVSGKGQNPGQAEKEARSKVLSMLPQNENRIGWSELAEKASSQGMSFRTLRKHLDELEQVKLVARIVDTTARPPRVYYQLMTSKVFRDIFDHISPDMLDTRRYVDGIAEIENSELRDRALGALLQMQTNLLIMEMIGVWDWGTTFSETQQAQDFYRIMIESFLAKMIVDLGIIFRAHSDALSRVVPSFFDRYTKACNEGSIELAGILSATQLSKHVRKHATKKP
jgi:DNA-binding HxlR family transcriptional regulator